MEDAYGYSEDSAPSTAQEGDAKTTTEPGEENETALLPKTILGGKEFKPGEEVVLKIVADHGEEVEVEYATEPAKDDSSEMEKSSDSMSDYAKG